MKHKLLCDLLNWHNWLYWRMSKEFEDCFPNDRSISRTCSICGISQIAQESVGCVIMEK